MKILIRINRNKLNTKLTKNIILLNLRNVDNDVLSKFFETQFSYLKN
jgi:hypothetical protein